MTVLEDVRDFVMGRAPRPTCDDCIADQLQITPRQHANHKTRELADAPGFIRRSDRCSSCGSTKKVISYTKAMSS